MKEDYPKQLKPEDRLNAILPYVGQEYTSTTGGGTLSLGILDAYHKENFNDGFSVMLKHLGDITPEDALAVYIIAIGRRSKMLDITLKVIEYTKEFLADPDLSPEKRTEYEDRLKETTDNLPEIEIYDEQFHVRGGKMMGDFDFWHGHKSLQELHFGFETENPSSYAEYSCVNPHMILQYLQRKGYMIPYNGVDLFDDGIATRIVIEK
jgi:hypothetical protein